MAAVLATSASASPTGALEQALSNFRTALNDEEKQRYGNWLNTSPKPDAASIIALTTEIDEQRAKGRSRRIGPRLLPFLEAIWQFSGVIDTFSNCNPSTAALVWGGVKCTLLVLSNFAGFFDKLASAFVKIGQSCPRYQEYSLLYPSSISLQDALSQYFAAVICLCQKSVEVSRRPGILQFTIVAFKPYEQQFGALERDIAQQAQNVNEEISLVSRQVQSQEAKLSANARNESSDYRNIMTKFSTSAKQALEDIRRWQRDADQRRLKSLKRIAREGLSQFNHKTAWKQARQQSLPGTAIWFEQHVQFLNWFQNSGPSFLWCAGNLGTGKTVLCSSVVAYLSSTVTNISTVSYFFCQSDDDMSLSSWAILGSIARQLLDSIIEGSDIEYLERLIDEIELADPKNIVRLLKTHLATHVPYFIVLDGLDACSSQDTKLISQAIAELLDDRDPVGDIRIFVAGRPDFGYKAFGGISWTHNLSLASPEVTADIEQFIVVTLDQKLEKDELKLGNFNLITKIEDALLAGAQGMFLWAYLLIEDVCIQTSDDDIIKSLHNIPTQLSQLFDRILTRIKAQGNESHTIKVLKWVAGTQRALTIAELNEALTIHPGQKSFNLGSLSNDLPRVLGQCGALIFQDEDEKTVHFVHRSVKQYLLSACDDENLFPFHFDRIDLDLEIGVLSLTYINYSNFQRQLVKSKQDNTKPVDPLRFMEGALGAEDSLTKRLAQHLLYKRTEGNASKNQIGRHLQDILGASDSIRRSRELKAQNFAFMEYARRYCLIHTRYLDPEKDRREWRIFAECLESDSSDVEKPWEETSNIRQFDKDPKEYLSLSYFTNRQLRALRWSLENDNLAVFRQFFLLARKPFPSFDVHESHCEVFLREIRETIVTENTERFAPTVCLSLRKFNPKGFTAAHWTRCILLLAVVLDLPAVIALVLKGSKEIFEPEQTLPWTLQSLAMAGIRLEEQRPREPRKFRLLNPQGPLSYLSVAIIFGYMGAFRILLDWYSGSRAALLDTLDTAIAYGKRDLANMIMDRLPFPPVSRRIGDSIHTSESSIASMIRKALFHGWHDMALTLLRLGADPNGVDSKNRTLLMYAASTGSMTLFRELLELGAVPVKEDRQRWTVKDHLLFLKNPSHENILEGYPNPTAQDIATMLELLEAKEREEQKAAATFMVVLAILAIIIIWSFLKVTRVTEKGKLMETQGEKIQMAIWMALSVLSFLILYFGLRTTRDTSSPKKPVVR